MCCYLVVATMNAHAQSPKPNIVFIMSDDLGLGSTEPYGSGVDANGLKHVTTPAIQSLADDGKKYTNAYSPASVCTPTRYGVLTGQYYWRDIREYGTQLSGDPNMIPSSTNIARRLNDDGYNTAFIGKWHLGGSGTNVVGQADEAAALEIGFDFAYSYKNHASVNPSYNSAYFEAKAMDEVVADWIGDQTSGTPFFLYLTPYAVHTDLTPHPDYDGTSAPGMGVFGDYINELDGSVQNVLDALEDNGFTNNTIVIFTSDNGGTDQSAGGNDLERTNGSPTFEPNDNLRGKKIRIFDAGFRVPFIIKWPGEVAAGTVSNEPVNLVDFYSSIIEMRGLSLAAPSIEAGDSHSFYKSWIDDAGQIPRGPMILMSFEGVKAIVHDGWKFINGEETAPNVNSGTYYMSSSRQNQELHEQLYQVSTDREEDNDVIGSHTAKANELRNLLNDLVSQGYSRGATTGGGGGGDPVCVISVPNLDVNGDLEVSNSDINLSATGSGLSEVKFWYVELDGSGNVIPPWTSLNNDNTAPYVSPHSTGLLTVGTTYRFRATGVPSDGSPNFFSDQDVTIVTYGPGGGGAGWPPVDQPIVSDVDGLGLILIDQGNEVELATVNISDNHMLWNATAHPSDASMFIIKNTSNTSRNLSKEDGNPDIGTRSSTNTRTEWEYDDSADDGTFYLINRRDGGIFYLENNNGTLDLGNSPSADGKWVIGSGAGARKSGEPAEELVETIEFSVYPNPFNDEVNIKGVKATDLVRVHDLSGAVIFSGIGTSTINLSEVKRGLYLVKVGDRELKIIKQ